MINGIYHDIYLCIYFLWLFNVAMENGPFIDDSSINGPFSIAALNSQRKYIHR